MELIRGKHNLRVTHRHCVATIGTFDGLHIGHQRLLRDLKERSLKYSLPSVVILFEPQPNEYFLGGKSPARLCRLREKLIMLKKYAIDRVLCLHFNKALSLVLAEDFIQQILVDGLAVKHLVVGDDFHFGYQRRGNYALLAEAGKRCGFTLEREKTVELDGQRISSTRVRQALQAGNLRVAASLLGGPYSMCGRVAHGNKRGRIIGFPTANIYLHRKVSPVHGVFCVTVQGVGDKPFYGVANVGNRPTVDGSRTLLEVHLFNFNREIYGTYIQVNFVHKLRDEMKFDSFDLLKQQILKDAECAKAYFASQT